MGHRMSKCGAIAAALLAASSGQGATDPLGHVNDVPPELERKVQAVVGALEERGYEVARGYWKLFGVDECKWPIRVIGNCYGNNPAAPYILAVLPQWRDEYVDRTTHLALGPVHRGYVGSYRLAEREAIVVLAELPPPGKYFGVQTYVFTRKGAIDPSDDVYRFVERSAPEMLDLLFDTAPDPSRVIVFSSIGNSNDEVVMSRPGESPWGTQRFIVVTPDATMTRDVTQALREAAGVSSDEVFSEPVAPELVNLGLDREADDLMTVVRYAMPDDETAGERWREALPMAVLRVRDVAARTQREPYPIPAYEHRTAESERWLTPSLEALVSAVKAEAGPGTCDESFINAYLDIDLVGQHCLGRPMNCLGDSQDTDTYQASPSFVLDPPGKMVAIAGTLATETGNATYVSLSINRFEVLEGVVNRSQKDLVGSAAGFPGVAHAEKLYAFYLSRACPEHTTAPCFEISTRDVPAGETIKVLQRNYIRPGTARGADPGTREEELLLRPRLIRLDPQDCTR